MTDQELQPYCGQNVELKYAGQVFVGKLVCGAEARTAIDAPYAIESQIANGTIGTSSPVYTPLAHAEAVEWVRDLAAPLSEDRLED